MKIILSLMLTLSCQMASANDFAAVVGLRSNTAESSTTGESVGSKTSFGAGVLGFFDIAADLQVRSGFIYNQRHYTAKTGTIDAEFNLAYADIPVTLMYKFADYGGAFVGPVIGLLAAKECKLSTGSCSFTKSPESLIIPIQLGVNFKFAPQFGGELYYEMISSALWENGIKNSKTVGANFLITFE